MMTIHVVVQAEPIPGKGDHGSGAEQEAQDVQENFLKDFEEFNVDQDFGYLVRMFSLYSYNTCVTCDNKLTI